MTRTRRRGPNTIMPKAWPALLSARPPSVVLRKRASSSMRASISPPRIECQGPLSSETKPSPAVAVPASAPTATTRAPGEGMAAAMATGRNSERSTLSNATAVLGSRPMTSAAMVSPPASVTRTSPSSANPSSEVTMRPARQTKPEACIRSELTETRLAAWPATILSSAVEIFSISVCMGPPLSSAQRCPCAWASSTSHMGRHTCRAARRKRAYAAGGTLSGSAAPVSAAGSAKWWRWLLAQAGAGGDGVSICTLLARPIVAGLRRCKPGGSGALAAGERASCPSWALQPAGPLGGCDPIEACLHAIARCSIWTRVPAVTRSALSQIRLRYVTKGRSLDATMEAALKADQRAGAKSILHAVAQRRFDNRAEGQRLRKLLRYERALWAGGVLRVAGVDEAGMSPLAGPVAAAAVIFAPGSRLAGIDDSKKLDATCRDRLAAEIKQAALAWCVAFAEVQEIDSINIYWAGQLAMRRAIEGLCLAPEHVLLDARRLKELKLPQHAIVKGDSKSMTMTHASFINNTAHEVISCRLRLR